MTVTLAGAEFDFYCSIRSGLNSSLHLHRVIMFRCGVLRAAFMIVRGGDFARLDPA